MHLLLEDDHTIDEYYSKQGYPPRYKKIYDTNVLNKKSEHKNFQDLKQEKFSLHY